MYQQHSQYNFKLIQPCLQMHYVGMSAGQNKSHVTFSHKRNVKIMKLKFLFSKGKGQLEFETEL